MYRRGLRAEDELSGRRFDVADVADALFLWQRGHSAREIARRLHMGRDRVRAITRRARSAGYVAGDHPLSREEWIKHAAVLFVDRTVPPGTAQRQELDRFRDAIEQGLITDSAADIWRRLRNEHGLSVALRTFTRYAREVRMAEPVRGTVGMSLSWQIRAARRRIRELEQELTVHRTRANMVSEARLPQGLQGRR